MWHITNINLVDRKDLNAKLEVKSNKIKLFIVIIYSQVQRSYYYNNNNIIL